jgi:hypothetical protein
MMKLQPNETVLTGDWFVQNGQARRDATAERIEWLISHQLQKISDSPRWGAWETLYRDPDDGRYWERTYPQSHRHGGGPRQLRVLTIDEAKRKYGVVVLES